MRNLYTFFEKKDDMDKGTLQIMLMIGAVGLMVCACGESKQADPFQEKSEQVEKDKAQLDKAAKDQFKESLLGKSNCDQCQCIIQMSQNANSAINCGIKLSNSGWTEGSGSCTDYCEAQPDCLDMQAVQNGKQPPNGNYYTIGSICS